MKLLHNARIHTFEPARPLASTLAVEAGRVRAAGGEELLHEFKRAERYDLGGRVILPGLTDAHLHLQQYALSRRMVDCEASTQEECLRRVAERLAASQPGDWIRGHGWNQNDWGGRWPSAADLEAAAPGRPVYLTAKSLHAAWTSRAALELAGVTASTPDPANGAILRGPDGLPTGILLEEAMKLVEKAIPEPAPESLAETFQREIFPALWRAGLTGVHDFDGRTCFQALQILRQRGELTLRVLKSLPKELLPQAAELGLRTGFGDEYLCLGAVKLFADGALGPHTAAMIEPYLDEPKNRGMLTLDGEAVFEIGCRAAESGISLAVHAIGDRAVQEVLNAFARLRAYERERRLPALRHRIEHVQTIRDEDARRLAELGIIASMQPIHATSDMEMTEQYLGGSRAGRCYAWRTLLAAGARLAFGSDAPVETPNPFSGLHAAVTRRRADGSPRPEGWGPAQRLTVREALEGFTLGPAFAAGAESRLGRLSPGFLADLIVLEDDPFTCEPEALRGLQPSATMVGGEWVWKT